MNPEYFSSEYVKASDGRLLYQGTWKSPKAKASVVANIVFIHGVGEHINRYHHVFNRFVAAGIRVFALDLRGFGRTGYKNGVMGDLEGYRTALQDVRDLVTRVKKSEGGDVPIFIMGHSMGGGLALRYAIDYPQDLSGVIASAPLVSPAPESAPNMGQRLAMALLRHPVGSLPTPNIIDTAYIARDEKVRKEYLNNPFVHPYVSVRTGYDILQNGKELAESLYRKLKLPLLIFHGNNDKLTSYSASKAFFDKVSVSDKKFRTWEDNEHELHNDFDRDFVIGGYVDWILAHARLESCALGSY